MLAVAKKLFCSFICFNEPKIFLFPDPREETVRIHQGPKKETRDPIREQSGLVSLFWSRAIIVITYVDHVFFSFFIDL